MLDRYILDGEIPIPEPNFIKWAMWFEKADRQVARTVIDTDEEVSTVFLGIDHQFVGGLPLLFETMIFGGKFNGEQWRYSTWEQAATGHNRVVEKLMKLEESTSP